jgi:hypothetical protein
MAVDLADLIEPLKREVSPPGTDLYPNAVDDEWFGALTDAFWEIRLYGFIPGYEENAAARGGPTEFSDGIVTPLNVTADYDDPTGWSDSDLARDLQQLVVLWAGWKITLTQMQNLSTTFRAKAGPVEFETQHAATVQKAILDTLRAKIDTILQNLSSYGASSSVVVLDAIVERTYSTATHDQWWLR